MSDAVERIKAVRTFNRAKLEADPGFKQHTARLAVAKLGCLTLEPKTGGVMTRAEWRIARIEADSKLPVKERVKKRCLENEKAEARAQLGTRVGKQSKRAKFSIDALSSRPTEGKFEKPKRVIRNGRRTGGGKIEITAGKRSFSDMDGDDFLEDINYNEAVAGVKTLRPIKRMRHTYIVSSTTCQFVKRDITIDDIGSLCERFQGLFITKVGGEGRSGLEYACHSLLLLAMPAWEVAIDFVGDEVKDDEFLSEEIAVEEWTLLVEPLFLSLDEEL